ncbi:MAG: D-sedoheptulose 7-phosphate isomerase [Nitrospirae bacterium]|nr:D-sedoheptulose 7-phosphate isomerase [Nitrospirota bacterium]
MKESVIKAVKESVSVKEKFFETHLDKVIEAAKTIADAFSNGKKLLLFGNGGSATDASHIAAEFINRFRRERPGLPAIALNTDMAVITSIANDYDYSEVFARQVKSLAVAGDVVIAISTGGGSKNVLNAVEAASKKKLTIVAFTGAKGVKFARMATIPFVVPSEDTARIQESHITLGHILCQLVEEILFELPAKNNRRKAASFPSGSD